MTDNSTSTADPAPSPDDLTCFCQLDGVLAVLSRKYAMQVVCLVGALEPVRYADIEETLADVSSSTLSARLEELAEAGLIAREQYGEIPPRVEYTITDDGEELCDLLEPLVRWADAHEPVTG